MDRNYLMLPVQDHRADGCKADGIDRIPLRSPGPGRPRNGFRMASATMRTLACAWLVSVAACYAATGNEEEVFSSGSGSAGVGGSSVVSVGVGGSLGAGGTLLPDGGTGSGGGGIITTLPPGFIATEVGGYKLGMPISGGSDPDAGAPGNENCGNILLGVVRDFKGRNEPGGNPDFEGPLYGNDITTNLVASVLGPDQKPVYASMCEEGNPAPAPTCPFGAETTTKANFDQWYRHTMDVNKPFLVELWLAPQAGGVFTFQSLSFFPLDHAGWGNSGADKTGMIRNFSFTTELHTRFQYNGGETFQFEGDDDVWVFINKNLAVDLGGLHPKAASSINLDASAAQLGLVTGNVYSLDLFHAERHTPESTFRIDTNLSFVDCGAVIPN
jgi:fibro-slime domain-containing protein